jgi:hypothetical protein
MPIEDRPRIRSASTKYDGSIHYEFDTHLIDHVDGCLRLFIPAGTPNRSYRGEGIFEADCVALFFPGDDSRGLNVFHYLTPYPHNGVVMASDMLTGAQLDGDSLSWIDLDLDVEVFADGRIELVDEDEFEEHQLRYRYPSEVIEGASHGADVALGLAPAGAFPFDRAQQLEAIRALGS